MTTISIVLNSYKLCSAKGRAGVKESFAMKNYAAGTDKTAIVVASFGTTYPSAVNALPAIVQDIRTAYPAHHGANGLHLPYYP